MPPLKGGEERPVEAGKRLLPPRADLNLLDTFGPEVPDGVLRNGLWQEKHRIEGLIAKRQNALGKMPTESAQPAVGMPQLLEVEHDAGPIRPRLLGGPLYGKTIGEHGGKSPRPRCNRLTSAGPHTEHHVALSASHPRKLNADGKVTRSS